MVILVLVLVAVAYVLLVGGGVWYHRSESSTGDDRCSEKPPWWTEGLATVLGPFSPSLDVGKLHVGPQATLKEGILTFHEHEVSILVPGAKERARRLELVLRAGPPLEVGYREHNPESSDEACIQRLTAEAPLRLAFTEARGTLTITRTLGPGSEEPTRVEFR